MPRTQSLKFAIRTRNTPLTHRPSLSSTHRTQNRQTSSLPSCRLHSHHINTSNSRHPPKNRAFTTYSSLYRYLLSSGHHTRPQLPFLHPSTSRPRPNLTLNPSQTSTFLTRYMTTERRQRWRQTLRWQLRFHSYFWPSLFLIGIMLSGLHQLAIEREYPTPRDWGFWERWYLRTARYTEFDEAARKERVLVDWQKAGRFYLGVLEALEKKKGSGTGKEKVNRDEEVLVDFEGDGKGGVGLGWDVGEQSGQWRNGYFEALMGAARCAENLDGMARKKGDEWGSYISWESVVGPRNSRPKPLPWDKKGGHLKPPHEEEMEDAFAAPEVYYMRVLTTVGFTTRQRLDAALAYADWCDFKGLTDTAGSMYDWALDIAAGALPMGADGVVDVKTGVIAEGKEEFVSENLLRASTAMGVHCARSGDVKTALPIFLSALRARRNLPAPTREQEREMKRKRQLAAKAQEEQSLARSYMMALKDLVVDSPYPEPPSSGNERPYHSLVEACEEVGLMTYVGEILFASSESEREKGLSWTRDSVGAAEAVLWVMEERQQRENEVVAPLGRERCRECLETGLYNWKQMARQMAVSAREDAERVESGDAASGGAGGWLGGLRGLFGGNGAAVQKAQEEVKKWEDEEAQIELRKLKTASLVHPLRPLTASSWVQA